MTKILQFSDLHADSAKRQAVLNIAKSTNPSASFDLGDEIEAREFYPEVFSKINIPIPKEVIDDINRAKELNSEQELIKALQKHEATLAQLRQGVENAVIEQLKVEGSKLEEELYSRLKEINPVYGVLGNHDPYALKKFTPSVTYIDESDPVKVNDHSIAGVVNSDEFVSEKFLHLYPHLTRDINNKNVDEVSQHTGKSIDELLQNSAEYQRLHDKNFTIVASHKTVLPNSYGTGIAASKLAKEKGVKLNMCGHRHKGSVERIEGVLMVNSSPNIAYVVDIDDMTVDVYWISSDKEGFARNKFEKAA
ncbi:hypothetical protein GOV04_04845 [Candidatus Woesearchaeota archaeon]|nr:hypothetical protein [Candidatus Woesearchaeota archaeon]